MLILTRRPGESIRIGDNIEIIVVDHDRGSVRIGVDAPRDIPVHRDEIYKRIQQERAGKRPPPKAHGHGR